MCPRQGRACRASGIALPAGHQIDGGADRRETQPIGSTDIAPQHLAEMHGDNALKDKRRAQLNSRLRTITMAQRCGAGSPTL